MSTLSDKREAFVSAYVGDAKFNATEAARLAGYQQPFMEGWRLRQIDEVQDAIRKRLEASAMSASEVLKRLGDMARADITDFVTDDGRVDLAAIRRAGLGHLVKEYTYQRGKGMTIKLHDSQSALEKLGKVHALFTDKTELTGKDGGPVEVASLTDEQHIAAIRKIYDEAAKRKE